MTFFNIFSKSRIKKHQKPEIIVDKREPLSVVNELQLLNIKIKLKHLEVADYLINKTAIERKTLSDFKSSIINKRLMSQLAELKQYPKNLLILEGEKESFSNFHENAFRGFILSTILDFQVPIIFTKNEKETAKYLSILAKKSKKPYSIRASKILKSSSQQIQFILEGFPNIGPAKAKFLIKNFKSLKNIFNAPEQELKPILGSRTKGFIELINKKLF